jgi:hypothetical protein
MGGYAEALGSFARDAGSKIVESLRSTDTGSKVADTFLSQLTETSRSPEGMKVAERLQDYDHKRLQVLNDLMKPVQSVQKVVQNDPAKIKAPIGQLHADLKASNHPAAMDTQKILSLDPANAQLNLESYQEKINNQSRLIAQQQKIGPNHAYVIGDIMPLYETGNPVDEAHANSLLNIVSNQLADTTQPFQMDTQGNFTKSGVDQSATKLNMKKALILENKFRVANNQAPLPVDINKLNTASVHEKSNAIERFSSQRARWYLAPMIAVNHMSTFFNASNAPLSTIYRGISTMGDREVKQLTDAAAVLTSQHFHMLGEDFKNSTGFLAAKTGMPEVGRLYGQMFHNPGFSFIRNAQLKFFAATGYHAAIDWAAKSVQGDKRAILELKEMGINPADVLKQGGKLTQEQKIKAIYNFTNNRAFVSRPLDRSLTATRSPWTRILTMFHGYVTFQQSFMRRELQKMLDSNDYVGIARYAGTVGLMFPAIAPMLKAAETFARSGSPKQTEESIENDYNRLKHPENVGQFTSEYLDMISYFGAWGVLHSFVTASHGDRLALALMGPIAGDAVRTAQDAINFSTKSTKTGKHNIKPLAKDLLQQTVPGAGNIIANQVFPAKDINN